ncbi:MAG TPA: hypothetical protein VNE40_03160 [Candidatus Dormibacteraeota bacterium]|nr:hypothetical protein [Candidatus Dormibacteraeota bacterium]
MNPDNESSQPIPEPQPAPTRPVMDVQPPPKAVPPATNETSGQTIAQPEPVTTPKAPKIAQPPRSPGVSLAIFATLIIVLGMAALITYAYLKSR